MTGMKDKAIASDNLKDIKNELNEAFKRITEDFESHLDTINENTSEIHANYEYIMRLESKMDKLSERLDTLQMLLRKVADIDEKIASGDEIIVQPLSDQEKRVFLVVYTSGDMPLTYKQIADKSDIPEALVTEYVTSMVEKGIPLIKEYRANKAHYWLDKSFRDKQAKENILKISQKTLSF